MAVAVDATSASAYPATHPITFAHTVGAGANRVLLVGVTTAGATPPSISSVTYGGVALTLITSATSTGALAGLYRLIAPTTGTANIVITLSATSGVFGGSGISFTGVDQSLPIDTSNVGGHASDATHSLTESITTGAANVYLVDVIAGQFGGTAGTETPGAGQTAILNAVNAAGFVFGASSYKSVGAAGAQTMSWTDSHSSDSSYVSALASVQPVIVAAGAKNRLMLLGVG